MKKRLKRLLAIGMAVEMIFMTSSVITLAEELLFDEYSEIDMEVDLPEDGYGLVLPDTIHAESEMNGYIGEEPAIEELELDETAFDEFTLVVSDDSDFLFSDDAVQQEEDHSDVMFVEPRESMGQVEWNMDSDELFEGYAMKQFYNNGISLYGTIAGDLLTGQSKIIYDDVKQEIQRIAAGKSESTVISIPVSKLLGATQFAYTAEDLGLPYIIDDD